MAVVGNGEFMHPVLRTVITILSSIGISAICILIIKKILDKRQKNKDKEKNNYGK